MRVERTGRSVQQVAVDREIAAHLAAEYIMVEVVSLAQVLVFSRGN